MKAAILRDSFNCFRRDIAIIVALGLFLRIAFIHMHPAVYGGDSVMRMMNADKILIAYQLPLLQLLLYLTNLISADPLTIRYLMSVLGAIAGVAFFLLSSRLWEKRVAFVSTLIFVFNPFLLVHSIVPYQEILMLLTLCLGLYFLFQADSDQNLFRASLFLGLACLTRYEAWIITAVAALFHWFNRSRPKSPIFDFRTLPKILPEQGGSRREPAGGVPVAECRPLPRHSSGNSASSSGLGETALPLCQRGISPFSSAVQPQYGTWVALLKTIFYFGWAPLLWILLQRGFSPEGTFVVEGFSDVGRLYRVPYILAMTLHHAGPVVLLLALPGLIDFYKKSLWKNPCLQMLLVGASLLLLALIFSAHGVPPDAVRYVTDREAHWLILFVFWAAGLGLLKIQNGSRLLPGLLESTQKPALRKLQKAIHLIVLLLALLWGLYETNRRIGYLVSQPNLRVDYAVAQYLERHLPAETKALVFAKPLPAGAIQDYLNKAYSKGGAKALQAAQTLVAAVDTGPFDYSRIVVNTRLGKYRILTSSHLKSITPEEIKSFLLSNRIHLAVVFSDYSSEDAIENQFLEAVRHSGKKKTILTHLDHEASIYEVSS